MIPDWLPAHQGAEPTALGGSLYHPTDPVGRELLSALVLEREKAACVALQRALIDAISEEELDAGVDAVFENTTQAAEADGDGLGLTPQVSLLDRLFVVGKVTGFWKSPDKKPVSMSQRGVVQAAKLRFGLETLDHQIELSAQWAV